jgi:hypothetical protein
MLLSLTSRRSQGRSLMRTARCVPSSRTTAWGSRRLPEPLLGSAHELDSWKRATQIQNFFIFRPAIGAAKISSRLSSMTDSGSRPRKPKRRSSTITTWGSWGSIQLLDLLPQLDLTSIDACFSSCAGTGWFHWSVLQVDLGYYQARRHQRFQRAVVFGCQEFQSPK